MPVAIVATPGAANANSFVTEAEADAYLNTRLNAAVWVAAVVDDKNRSLIEATRELNLLYWEGQRVTETQSLSWPRQFAINPDIPQIIGVGDLALLYFAEDEIPQRIKDATCELALEFIRAGTTDLAALDGKQNIIRERVDVLETEYSTPQNRAQGLSRFPRIVMLITDLLDPTQSGGMTLIRT